MITFVHLKGWKSHLDSEFAFTPGVNALVGIMGGGKSSVTDAICFALFGTFPALQSRKVGLDELVMKRPQRLKECEVWVTLSANGAEYELKRKVVVGKGTVEAEIRKSGALVDVNTSNVTRAIESLLQVDYDLFSKAIYSEQNSL